MNKISIIIAEFNIFIIQTSFPITNVKENQTKENLSKEIKVRYFD